MRQAIGSYGSTGAFPTLRSGVICVHARRTASAMLPNVQGQLQNYFEACMCWRCRALVPYTSQVTVGGAAAAAS